MSGSHLLSASPDPEPDFVPDASPAILDSESSDEEVSEDVSSQNTSGKDEETATCLWGDCGKVFTQLASLIEHIHTGALLARRCARPSNDFQNTSA